MATPEEGKIGEKMINSRYTHNIWKRTIAAGVVCLFLANQLACLPDRQAWAYPADTLKPPGLDNKELNEEVWDKMWDEFHKEQETSPDEDAIDQVIAGHGRLAQDLSDCKEIEEELYRVADEWGVRETIDELRSTLARAELTPEMKAAGLTHGRIQIIPLKKMSQLPRFRGRTVWGHFSTPLITIFTVEEEEGTAEEKIKRTVGRIFHEARGRSSELELLFKKINPAPGEEAEDLAEAFHQDSQLIERAIVNPRSIAGRDVRRLQELKERFAKLEFPPKIRKGKRYREHAAGEEDTENVLHFLNDYKRRAKEAGGDEERRMLHEPVPLEELTAQYASYMKTKGYSIISERAFFNALCKLCSPRPLHDEKAKRLKSIRVSALVPLKGKAGIVPTGKPDEITEEVPLSLDKAARIKYGISRIIKIREENKEIVYGSKGEGAKTAALRILMAVTADVRHQHDEVMASRLSECLEFKPREAEKRSMGGRRDEPSLMELELELQSLEGEARLMGIDEAKSKRLEELRRAVGGRPDQMQQALNMVSEVSRVDYYADLCSGPVDRGMLPRRALLEEGSRLITQNRDLILNVLAGVISGVLTEEDAREGLTICLGQEGPAIAQRLLGKLKAEQLASVQKTPEEKSEKKTAKGGRGQKPPQQGPAKLAVEQSLSPAYSAPNLDPEAARLLAELDKKLQWPFTRQVAHVKDGPGTPGPASPEGAGEPTPDPLGNLHAADTALEDTTTVFAKLIADPNFQSKGAASSIISDIQKIRMTITHLARAIGNRDMSVSSAMDSIKKAECVQMIETLMDVVENKEIFPTLQQETISSLVGEKGRMRLALEQLNNFLATPRSYELPEPKSAPAIGARIADASQRLLQRLDRIRSLGLFRESEIRELAEVFKVVPRIPVEFTTKYGLAVVRQRETEVVSLNNVVMRVNASLSDRDDLQYEAAVLHEAVHLMGRHLRLHNEILELERQLPDAFVSIKSKEQRKTFFRIQLLRFEAEYEAYLTEIAYLKASITDADLESYLKQHHYRTSLVRMAHYFEGGDKHGFMESIWHTGSMSVSRVLLRELFVPQYSSKVPGRILLQGLDSEFEEQFEAWINSVSQRHHWTMQCVDSIHADLKKGQKTAIVIDTSIGNLEEYGRDNLVQLLERMAEEMGVPPDQLEIIMGVGSYLRSRVNAFLRQNETGLVRGIVSARDNNVRNYEIQFDEEEVKKRVNLVAVDDTQVQNTNPKDLHYNPIMPALRCAFTGQLEPSPYATEDESGRDSVIKAIITFEPVKPVSGEDLMRHLEEDAIFLKNA